MFLLIKIGVSPYKNPINTKYDLFFDNYTNLGANYFFPYHFCIVNEPQEGLIDVRIPFFSNGGFVRGFYHEPHTLTFMVFPALFLFLYWIRKKWGKAIVILLYILIALISSSGTNVLATFICCFVYILVSSRRKPKLFILWIALAILIAAVVITYSFEISLYLEAKSGSSGYTESMMYFATHPKTLFGSSFYSTEYVDYQNPELINQDVGYISFVLNIVFLLICLTKIGKLFKSRDYMTESVMLAVIYFFCHSTKVVMVSYSLSMLMFVCFLLTVFTENNTKPELIQENQDIAE